MPDGERYQTIAGIGDARHAGVGHQRDRTSLFKLNDQLRRAGEFVVLVVADGPLFNSEVGEQFLGLPRVLASDEIDFLQRAKRPKSDVFEIADRCGDQVKRWLRGSGHGASVNHPLV